MFWIVVDFKLLCNVVHLLFIIPLKGAFIYVSVVYRSLGNRAQMNEWGLITFTHFIVRHKNMHLEGLTLNTCLNQMNCSC